MLSPPFPLPGVASHSADVITPLPCHASFLWCKDEIAISASSFDNASSCRFPSQTEIKALNMCHHRRPPSSYRSTHTLHYYERVVISTLATFYITQPRLHFASSLLWKGCHLNLSHLLHHSTASPFCLLPSQSTTPSELHLPPSFPFTTVPCPLYLHTITPMMMN
jgi:hypothetical protein